MPEKPELTDLERKCMWKATSLIPKTERRYKTDCVIPVIKAIRAVATLDPELKVYVNLADAKALADRAAGAGWWSEKVVKDAPYLPGALKTDVGEKEKPEEWELTLTCRWVQGGHGLQEFVSGKMVLGRVSPAFDSPTCREWYAHGHVTAKKRKFVREAAAKNWVVEQSLKGK